MQRSLGVGLAVLALPALAVVAWLGRRLRASLAEAERRLEERLQELYVSGDPDPLAVLLGAQSLPDALAALDSVDRFARADREIVAEVSAARGDVRRALADLAARRAALDAATSEARAARDSLAAARDERSSYLASLTRRRELNQRRIAALTERAATIESQATEVAATQLSAPAAAPSAGPVPAGGTQMTVVATGYSIDGTTSTGMPAGWGVAAVDPSVIPLGTRMTVPGYGEAVAADTGSAIGGAAIDLWFPTPAQALAWGRRTVTITLH
jgi:3D (Asp-Asp-Asp) domain-containing protein